MNLFPLTWADNKTLKREADGTLDVAVTSLTPVSGTVTANQGTAGASPWPVSASGTVTANQGTAGASPWPVSVSGSVTPSVPTTVLSGKSTVTNAGTRVQLPANACVSVTVKALAANTGTVYVGGSGVSSLNGFELAAGDSISLDIANTNAVYVDASVNSQGVSWLAVN